MSAVVTYTRLPSRYYALLVCWILLGLWWTSLQIVLLTYASRTGLIPSMFSGWLVPCSLAAT